MCITNVTAIPAKPPQYAWKVVRVTSDGMYTGPFYEREKYSKGEVVEVKVPSEGSHYEILAWDGTTYPQGFHFFTTRDEARRAKNFMHMPRRMRLVKAKIEGVVAYGTQKADSFSGNAPWNEPWFDIIVARKMTVLHESR